MEKELNKLKYDLLDAAREEMAKGKERVNTEELGEVIDMIKDLAEAEKCCMEAAYYENVVEAMGDRYGYTRDMYPRDTRPFRESRYMDNNRMGYGKIDEIMSSVQDMYAMSPKDERERLKSQLKDMVFKMEQK